MAEREDKESSSHVNTLADDTGREKVPGSLWLRLGCASSRSSCTDRTAFCGSLKWLSIDVLRAVCQQVLFLPLAPLRPHWSPVTGRQVKTEKKRGPSCTSEGETAYLKTWSRARCTCRGCQNGQDVVPKSKQGHVLREPMSRVQRAAECEAAEENCS